MQKLAKQYSLPDIVQVLQDSPSKFSFSKQVRTAITAFWHDKLCKEAAGKISLKFLRCEFLSLGKSPHPIWTSCVSTSSIRSATIQMKCLLGTYRCDAVTAKWSGKEPTCSLPGCSGPIGDISHLLSGNCHALRDKLGIAIRNGLALLKPFDILYNAVLTALSFPSEDWLFFLLDPSSSPLLIPHRQQFGLTSLNPVFRFSRSVIWAMHREHLRLKRQKNFLFVE